MKKLFPLIILAAIVLAGCNTPRDKVVITYPDGSPRLVYSIVGSDEKPTRVGERLYYENGKLQYSKHFSGKEETPTGEWEYFYDNGQHFATANFSKEAPLGRDWKFFNREGQEYSKTSYDSVCVKELGEFQTPATVVFYRGNDAEVLQFYSNYNMRSSEHLVNDVRQGRVIFYHPNGIPQTEASYENGKEEGTYIVYRENGIPYYRGTYSQGQRVGIWEFYDEEGTLARTQDFGSRE